MRNNSNAHTHTYRKDRKGMGRKKKKRATVREAKIKDKIIKMQQSHVQEKVQKKLKRDKTRSTSRGGGVRSYTPQLTKAHSTPLHTREAHKNTQTPTHTKSTIKRRTAQRRKENEKRHSDRHSNTQKEVGISVWWSANIAAVPAWARQRAQNEKKCTAWLTATVARRTQAGSRILLHRTLCETVHRTELHEYSREVDREDEGGLRETPKWTITSISMMHRFRKKERRTHPSLERSAPSPSPTSPHTLRNHHRNSSAFSPRSSRESFSI